MFRAFLTASLLLCFSTAGSASSFKYTSSSVRNLDYFKILVEAGDYFYYEDVSPSSTPVFIEFDIDERIRKNTTYVYNRSAKNWTITILGGGTDPEYDVEDAHINFIGDLYITTDENRQVVDWDIEMDTFPYFEWASSPREERSFVYWDFYEQECIDRYADSRDCYTDEFASVSGIGTWEAVTPVPLPASLPLLVVGLLGLGVWRRRQT